MEKLLSLRAERRRREARRETFTTPGLVTTRRSILGPPAEGRPGPSGNDNDVDNNDEKKRNKTKFPAQVDEKLGCFCPFPPQVYFD